MDHSAGLKQQLSRNSKITMVLKAQSHRDLSRMGFTSNVNSLMGMKSLKNMCED